MAYEFELAMKSLAVEMLKKAHSSFMSGDMQGYEDHLKEAAAAIEGIAKLGISEDNPRFLWVGRLDSDWKLVNALKKLKFPRILCEIYSECYYVPYPVSLVLDRETPYLPEDCKDVFEFYQVSIEDAESFAEELSQAVALYGELTDGGGAGTDLLFRAGAVLRRGEQKLARQLACQAGSIGGKWIQGYVAELISQTKQNGQKEG